MAERLLRRYGSTRLFPAALALGTALAVAYATKPAFLVLLALRMAWGLCWSFIRHTGVMTTIGLAESRRAASFMGIYVGLVQGGLVAGTLIAGFFYDAFGFSNAFLLAAARGFLVSLVGTGLIMSTLGCILKYRFGDTLTVGSLAIGVAAVNGVLLASRYLTNGIGSPLFGIIIDRHGLVRAQVASFVLSGSALLAAGVLGGTAALIPFVLLFFISSAVLRLAVESQAAVAGPHAYARLATAMDFGSAVGPMLGWIGIEVARSQSVFWVGGVLLLAGALLAGALLAGIHPQSSTRSQPITT